MLDNNKPEFTIPDAPLKPPTQETWETLRYLISAKNEHNIVTTTLHKIATATRQTNFVTNASLHRLCIEKHIKRIERFSTRTKGLVNKTTTPDDEAHRPCNFDELPHSALVITLKDTL